MEIKDIGISTSQLEPKDIRTRIADKRAEIETLKAAIHGEPTQDQREQMAKLITELAIMRTMIPNNHRPSGSREGIEYR